MISKIKDKVIFYKGKKLCFRYNGTRNQIEEFEGVILECYNYIFLVQMDKIVKSFSYSDILIGVLEINI